MRPKSDREEHRRAFCYQRRRVRFAWMGSSCLSGTFTLITAER